MNTHTVSIREKSIFIDSSFKKKNFTPLNFSITPNVSLDTRLQFVFIVLFVMIVLWFCKLPSHFLILTMILLARVCSLDTRYSTLSMYFSNCLYVCMSGIGLRRLSYRRLGKDIFKRLSDKPSLIKRMDLTRVQSLVLLFIIF